MHGFLFAQHANLVETDRKIREIKAQQMRVYSLIFYNLFGLSVNNLNPLRTGRVRRQINQNALIFLILDCYQSSFFYCQLPIGIVIGLRFC